MILIKNEKLRKEMGEWGIRESQKYSWPKITDQILNFYQSCLKNKQKKEIKKSPSLEKTISKILNKTIKVS